MNNLIFGVLLLCTVSLTAQKTIDDYAFVIVPEQFEFVKGKDKYDLNSMTKYYLEKKDITSYFISEAPDFSRCEVLSADVEKLRSLLNTKLVFVLKDCNGTVVFRSEEGKSKLKEFRQSYQEALRNMFNTFEKESVYIETEMAAQSGPNTIADVKPKEVSTAIEAKEVDPIVVVKAADPTTAVEVITVKETKSTANVQYIPQATFSNYTNGRDNFMLKKSDSGFTLFKVNADESFSTMGTLDVTDAQNFYLERSNGAIVKGYFNQKQDIVINESGVEVVYTKQL